MPSRGSGWEPTRSPYVNSNNPPLPQIITLYFGNRPLVPLDRLGSVQNNATGRGLIAYFPWGEERTSTPDGTDKFATYFRDGTVGTSGQYQDYASARYYNNNFGRFWSVDPGGVETADPKDPQSWNRIRLLQRRPGEF